MSKNISRVRGNFPYSAAGEAGRILGLGGPHAARRPYVVHPWLRLFGARRGPLLWSHKLLTTMETRESRSLHQNARNCILTLKHLFAVAVGHLYFTLLFQTPLRS